MLEKDTTRRMNSDANDVAELNEEKSKDRQKEVKVVSESLRFLSFREIIKGLSPHRCYLKDQMKDKTVSYVDLLKSTSIKKGR